MPAACGDKWEGTHDYQSKNRQLSRRDDGQRDAGRQIKLMGYASALNEASSAHKERWVGVYHIVG